MDVIEREIQVHAKHSTLAKAYLKLQGFVIKDSWEIDDLFLKVEGTTARFLDLHETRPHWLIRIAKCDDYTLQ